LKRNPWIEETGKKDGTRIAKKDGEAGLGQIGGKCEKSRPHGGEGSPSGRKGRGLTTKWYEVRVGNKMDGVVGLS